MRAKGVMMKTEKFALPKEWHVNSYEYVSPGGRSNGVVVRAYLPNMQSVQDGEHFVIRALKAAEVLAECPDDVSVWDAWQNFGGPALDILRPEIKEKPTFSEDYNAKLKQVRGQLDALRGGLKRQGDDMQALIRWLDETAASIGKLGDGGDA